MTPTSGSTTSRRPTTRPSATSGATRLDGKGKAERVSPAGEPGAHVYNAAPGMRWAFHTYHIFTLAPATDLVAAARPTSRCGPLAANKQLRERVAAIRKGPVEWTTLRGADGVALNGVDHEAGRFRFDADATRCSSRCTAVPAARPWSTAGPEASTSGT